MERTLGNIVLQQNAARYGTGRCVLQSAAAALRQFTRVGNAATEQGAAVCAYKQGMDVQNSALAWDTGAAALDALDEAPAADFTGLYNA